MKFSLIIPCFSNSWIINFSWIRSEYTSRYERNATEMSLVNLIYNLPVVTAFGVLVFRECSNSYNRFWYCSSNSDELLLMCTVRIRGIRSTLCCRLLPCFLVTICIFGRLIVFQSIRASTSEIVSTGTTRKSTSSVTSCRETCN